MVKHTYGNLLDAKVDVICHQVNCQGKMGSGVAKQVRERFPEAYVAYMNMCRLEGRRHPEKLLGRCQFVEVERDGRVFYIANLFGQNGYGYDGKQYTSIDAFRSCIDKLAEGCLILELPRIALPYKIGCCRGGADWNQIYPIIEEGLHRFDVTLFEYKE